MSEQEYLLQIVKLSVNKVILTKKVLFMSVDVNGIAKK